VANIQIHTSQGIDQLHRRSPDLDQSSSRFLAFFFGAALAFVAVAFGLAAALPLPFFAPPTLISLSFLRSLASSSFATGSSSGTSTSSSYIVDGQLAFVDLCGLGDSTHHDVFYIRQRSFIHNSLLACGEHVCFVESNRMVYLIVTGIDSCTSSVIL
jgi:hypothetical protein